MLLPSKTGLCAGTGQILLATALLTSPSFAQERLVNGSFEAGNTGFSSAYTFSPSDLGGDTTYDVNTDPNADNGNFASFGDHTTGSGEMLVLNGATQSNVMAWTETVDVVANSSYDFSAWVASAYPSSPADLDFSVNGTLLGSFTAPSTAGDWHEFKASWNSGTATSATVQIVDLNTDFSGNDFALDDLSLKGPSPVPEASSVISLGLLLALGFGGVVRSERRRKGQTAI